MSGRIVYLPMVYGDTGEPVHPDWNYEGENSPTTALVEALGNWEIAAEFRDHQKILVAKVEETNEIPPENEWDDLRDACEGEWKPGDSWRKWLGCVEITLSTQEVPKPK